MSCEALGSRVRPGTAPVTAHSPEALLVLENPVSTPVCAWSPPCDSVGGCGPSPQGLERADGRHRSGTGAELAAGAQSARGLGLWSARHVGPHARPPPAITYQTVGFRVARSFSFPGEARSHLCAKQSRVSHVRLSPAGQTEPTGLGLGCEPDRSARGWLRLPEDRPLHLPDRAPCCPGCGRPACFLFLPASQALRELTLFLPGWLCPGFLR